MSNKPEQSDEFARELVTCLDNSLDELDELTQQRLKTARAKALQQARPGSAKWLALGVAAATITAVLLVPSFWHQHGGDGVDADEVAALEVPPSAQELDDLDMLIALEDEDA